MGAWLLFAAACGGEHAAAAEPARNFVYLSVPGAKRIDLYSQNAADGQLTKVAEQPTRGEAAALAVDPQRRYLFAAYRPEGQLAAYRRDSATGRLTLINVVDAGIDPAHLAVDRSGRWLLAAYYVAAKVTVHRIGDDGALSAVPQSQHATTERAHAAVLSPDDRFAYVPHTGPNRIFAYRFDAARGDLEPASPTLIRLPADTGPRHGAFHPRLPVVYFNHEQGNAVQPFDWDVHSGQITPRPAVSTLPSGYDQPNATAELKVHPSGRFVYCANRGHHSLARFQVDPATGDLKALGQTPTEPTPRSFDLDPAGRFLYAGGESSGKLAGYRIDESTGDLVRFGEWTVGPRLWWVLVVKGLAHSP